jgi:4-hydroxybenzoate polyprenyltransferase
MNYFDHQKRILNKFLIAFINLILYSNLWIALAATCMALQTQLLIGGQLNFSPLMIFIFFATLFLYAIHRIVGLNKYKPFHEDGRYFVIQHYKMHILGYACLAGLLGGYFFLIMPLQLKVALILPCFLSLGYVVPLFKGSKRLRDYNYIKIFLIAITWSWITVYLPAKALGLASHYPVWIMMLERSLFVFAITIPFDIRDLEIDQYNQVKTIPSVWGVGQAKLIAHISNMIAFLLVCLNVYMSTYSLNVGGVLLFSLVLASLFIHLSGKYTHDYYYTGLIDGLMILQFVCCILVA